LTLVRYFLAEKGTGRDSRIQDSQGVELPYHSTRSCRYYSIFGLLDVSRAYFWRDGEGVAPLDAELNLPDRRYSYLLQEWAKLIGVDESFETVTDRLGKFLGIQLWSQGIQNIALDAGPDVDAFYEQKGPPPPGEEGEILVAAVDGKGVPLRKEKTPRKARLGRGEKPNKKKEAVVSAVYTIDRHHRDVEDILREIDEDGCFIEPSYDLPERPEPCHKRLRATLAGKDAAFEEVRRQFDERDPEGRKERVFLSDADPALQKRAQTYLGAGSNVTMVLDLIHVIERLWGAVRAFHPEGSSEAAVWVMQRLQMLLEGKVGRVIGGLRQSITKRKLSASKRRAVESAADYMDNNRQFMRYDEYLAKGYPIATGVVEGGCGCLVRDRMEETGMRWTLEGAQAILELRAVDKNGDWQEFWRFRAQREHQRLYASKAA